MKTVFGIILLCFPLISLAKIDAELFGENGSKLFQELKDSGVMDQFEQELEKMLHEKGDAIKEKAEEVIKGKSNPSHDFVYSYCEEKNILLDPRILAHLATLPVGEEGESKHFVHLTQIIDKTWELAQLDDEELDKKVLDVIKRVKSLPVMKTSLNKLNLVQTEEEPIVKKHDQKEPDSAMNELFNPEIVKEAVDFIKNLKKKPDFILEVLLPMLQESGLIGDEVMTMAKIYGKTLVRSEAFIYAIDSIADFIELFSKSESGMKMIGMIPDMLMAEDKESMINVFKVEAEKNWNEFIAHIDSSDNVDKLVQQLAGMVVTNVAWVQDLAKDEMKIAIANTFLISQGLPAIKTRKLTESMFDLANKCIKLFTTWKFDLEPYKQETLKQIELVQKEYISSSEYGKLTQTEQKTLVARFMTENMVEPFKALWIIREKLFTAKDVQCAESLLCHLNAHMKKQSLIKSEVTKLFSLIASWSWTFDQDLDKRSGLDQWSLYKAIWDGHKPETDCSVQYTPTGKENVCHVLPFQSDMMSLNFEHTEL